MFMNKFKQTSMNCDKNWSYFFFISYNYLLFIILFITYFIFMLCPQLASAKYVDTWIPYYRKLTLHEIKVLEINAT